MILFLPSVARILWISEVEQLILANHFRLFSSLAHARALQRCDLAKKAFINRLFRPQAILSVVFSVSW